MELKTILILTAIYIGKQYNLLRFLFVPWNSSRAQATEIRITADPSQAVRIYLKSRNSSPAAIMSHGKVTEIDK
jgi:hypothetical protein